MVVKSSYCSVFHCLYIFICRSGGLIVQGKWTDSYFAPWTLFPRYCYYCGMWIVPSLQMSKVRTQVSLCNVRIYLMLLENKRRCLHIEGDLNVSFFKYLAVWYLPYHQNREWFRLDFQRSLESGLRSSPPSVEERGLLSRTAAGDWAYEWLYNWKRWTISLDSDEFNLRIRVILTPFNCFPSKDYIRIAIQIDTPWVSIINAMSAGV